MKPAPCPAPAPRRRPLARPRSRQPHALVEHPVFDALARLADRPDEPGVARATRALTQLAAVELTAGLAVELARPGNAPFLAAYLLCLDVAEELRPGGDGE